MLNDKRAGYLVSAGYKGSPESRELWIWLCGLLTCERMATRGDVSPGKVFGYAGYLVWARGDLAKV